LDPDALPSECADPHKVAKLLICIVDVDAILGILFCADIEAEFDFKKRTVMKIVALQSAAGVKGTLDNGSRPQEILQARRDSCLLVYANLDVINDVIAVANDAEALACREVNEDAQGAKRRLSKGTNT
jgi:hypothetical protein